MTEKRSSTRISVLSKSMKTVDEETRREVRDKRLRALEADNYNEEMHVETAIEDNYSSQESEDDEPASKKRRAKPKLKPKLKAKSKFIPKQRRIRDLDRIIDSQRQQLQQPISEDNSPQYNYVTVEAPPSAIPARKFCSVCGYWSKYTCTRCGMRYCCLRCFNSHKETRCLKFSVM